MLFTIKKEAKVIILENIYLNDYSEEKCLFHLKPKYEHSNPEIRRKAIKKIIDQKNQRS